MIALEKSAFCPNLLQIICVYHVAGATSGLITTVRPGGLASMRTIPWTSITPPRSST